MTRLKKNDRRTVSSKVKLLMAGLLVSAPVLATGGGGGGMSTGSYIGELPPEWFQDEPCPNGGIAIYEDPLVLEYQFDVAGVAADDNPNTYLKCTASANLQTLICNAGLADGTVLGCRDVAGPHLLPAPGNIVYMQYDPGDPAGQPCNILIGTGNEFGIADPKCRDGGDGDGSSTGGSSGGGTCNAANAAAVLTTGQTTNIASNACVRLKNEAGWSTINPLMQARPGTAAYPVPFTYSSCIGTGSASLTGDWQSTYLLDGGAASQANIGCDIFVQLGGSGSQVSFTYYE